MNASQAGVATPPIYSLVIPIYNEEAVLPLLVRRVSALLDALDGPAEAILVDDGSKDTSAIFLRSMSERDGRFRLIELSRNFGHQVAITAGMDAARGDAVIVMDADLQDPPEIVLDLVAKWKEGFEIVYARRIRREGETLFKRLTREPFLPPAAIDDVGDHPARRRRLPPDRPQGAFDVQEHA